MKNYLAFFLSVFASSVSAQELDLSKLSHSTLKEIRGQYASKLARVEAGNPSCVNAAVLRWRAETLKSANHALADLRQLTYTRNTSDLIDKYTWPLAGQIDEQEARSRHSALIQKVQKFRNELNGLNDTSSILKEFRGAHFRPDFYDGWYDLRDTEKSGSLGALDSYDDPSPMLVSTVSRKCGLDQAPTLKKLIKKIDGLLKATSRSISMPSRLGSAAAAR